MSTETQEIIMQGILLFGAFYGVGVLISLIINSGKEY